MLPNLPSHCQHVLQIGRAVLFGGRAHGNEHHLGMLHRFAHGLRERKPPSLQIALHHVFQTWLVNGYAASQQQPDTRLIMVNPHHMVTRLGQTRCRDQPHITCTHYHNVHRAPPLQRMVASLHDALTTTG